MAWREDAQFTNVTIAGTLTLEGTGAVDLETESVTVVDGSAASLFDAEADDVVLGASGAASTLDTEQDDITLGGGGAASTLTCPQDDVLFEAALESSTFDVEQDVITLGIDSGSSVSVVGAVLDAENLTAGENPNGEASTIDTLYVTAAGLVQVHE